MYEFETNFWIRLDAFALSWFDKSASIQSSVVHQGLFNECEVSKNNCKLPDIRIPHTSYGPEMAESSNHVEICVLSDLWVQGAMLNIVTVSMWSEVAKMHINISLTFAHTRCSSKPASGIASSRVGEGQVYK